MLPNKPSSIRVNSEFKYENIDKRRQKHLHASQLDVNVCQVNNVQYSERFSYHNYLLNILTSKRNMNFN